MIVRLRSRKTKPHSIPFYLVIPRPLRSTPFSLPALFPSSFQGRIIAALAHANRSASGGNVERWLLGILLRARYAPRAIRFLRCRCPLSTLPPSRTRCAACIGCDQAALQLREQTSWLTQPNRTATPP